jgi:uncharacterized RDD family membrane protein YckC
MEQENRYRPPKAAVADVISGSQDGPGALASRWARLGASLIDGLVAFAVGLPLLIASGAFQNVAKGVATNPAMRLAFAVLGIVGYLIFHGYLLHTSGQTIGKRLVGTRIVSVEDNRILPLWKVFTLRYLTIAAVTQIPGIGPFLRLIDTLFIIRGDKRCLHDLIAGTKVIDATSPWKGPTDLNDAD